MSRILSSRQLGMWILLGILCITLGIVAWSNTRALFRGAVLSVENPIAYATYTDPLQVISGTAKNARMVRINGASVPITTDGDFSKPLLLQPGYNIIEVYARDKFGDAVTRTYPIVLQTN